MCVMKWPKPRSSDEEPEHWRLFSPKIDDTGAANAALRKAITEGQPDPSRALCIIADANRAQSLVAQRTRCAALILRDLAAMGWQLQADRHAIYVRPGMSARGSNKAAIRCQLEFGRDDQLNDRSTRRFIATLERPSRFSRARPVTDLIADGRRLARQLGPIAQLPRVIRDARLAEICQPYLQLVDADAHDEHSGIRLMDIWRYFRHTWANRYRSTPGRNLFYLIRDAAQPNHPVMAITALGNAVMQLTSRDTQLGWTRGGLARLIQDGVVTGPEILTAFKVRLAEDLSQLYSADLPISDGIPECISDEILDRLLLIEQRSGTDRTAALKDCYENDLSARRVGDVSAVDLAVMAQTPLFRAKRARAARELLRAYRSIRDTPSFDALASTSEGQWAIGATIRQLKKRFSATGMMEITVCGAVAPYNHLLGGKLACLLMASPDVRRDYAVRYGGVYSIIASQMAGRPIVKEPCLVYLGTTSLYSDRSSQYNRVRLPAGSVDGQDTPVCFQSIGKSEGFGSPNLSQETEAALVALTDRVRDYRNVNFVFGEGQSPKLRQLREGFAALGLSRADVLNHGSQRLIYALALASNTTRYLLGVDPVPRYCIAEQDHSNDQIAAYWRTRWLASRLDHHPAIDAVSRSSPLQERLSRLIPDAQTNQQLNLFLSPNIAEDQIMPHTAEDEKVAFIRRLYRDESGYSDHVRIARLRELNVKTRLETIVRQIIQAGGSVVITGNAGDGKTHTIRLLDAELQRAGAEVIPDASQISQDKIVRIWEEARSSSRPLCIAINEGPLVDLIRAHRTEHPWLDDVRSHLLMLMRYVPVDESDGTGEPYQPERGATVVIDLSLRRTLTPDLVGKVIDKISDDMWYTACPGCPSVNTCPVTYNRTMLRDVRVKERLVALLQRVAERGVRATFRELLSYGSFLIFGGRSCAELVRDQASEQSRYYWNAFVGQGLIFENLEVGLDPVRQTDPRIDESLWSGNFEPAQFIGNEHAPITIQDFDQTQERDAQDSLDCFAALKRRWYFEHSEGRLRHATCADQWFSELQDSRSATQLRVGRLISRINAWWKPADANQQDRLRLWTRLSYSPRAQGKAMVSGRDVSGLELALFRPTLAPALAAAFGTQVVDHLLLAPPKNIRFASLLVDRRLLGTLNSVGLTEQAAEVGRRLVAFNDALSRHAEVGSHVRTIEILDPVSELDVRVRVDLSQSRYDSAE
jgi:hypothetical protein